jgi:hypothetical protein
VRGEKETKNENGEKEEISFEMDEKKMKREIKYE